MVILGVVIAGVICFLLWSLYKTNKANCQIKIFNAVSSGDIEAAEKIISHVEDIDAWKWGESILSTDVERTCETALHMAITNSKGELGLVRLLLNHGADVNYGSYITIKIKFPQWEPPLDCAIRLGYSDIVKELLIRGATTWSWTIGIAEEYGNLEIVQILKEAKNDD